MFYVDLRIFSFEIITRTHSPRF